MDLRHLPRTSLSGATISTSPLREFGPHRSSGERWITYAGECSVFALDMQLTQGRTTMAKGGYRPGAGRPKGSRTPRAKPIDKLPADIRSAAWDSGVTPLEYMLCLMR